MKRILSILLSLCMAVSAMAADFAGRTYRNVMTYEGHKVTTTVRFISDTKGTFTMSAPTTGKKAQTGGFTYKVNGDRIDILQDDGLDGYYIIDTEHQYGDDCIIILDGYGNVAMVLERTSSAPSTKAKSGKKKSRRK